MYREARFFDVWKLVFDLLFPSMVERCLLVVYVPSLLRSLGCLISEGNICRMQSWLAESVVCFIDCVLRLLVLSMATRNWIVEARFSEINRFLFLQFYSNCGVGGLGQKVHPARTGHVTEKRLARIVVCALRHAVRIEYKKRVWCLVLVFPCKSKGKKTKRAQKGKETSRMEQRGRATKRS